MGIEIEIRLVFARHCEHELRQQCVLEDVGKIAGVELMSIGKHLK
jgi:hypothetical protein